MSQLIVDNVHTNTYKSNIYFDKYTKTPACVRYSLSTIKATIIYVYYVRVPTVFGS